MLDCVTYRLLFKQPCFLRYIYTQDMPQLASEAEIRGYFFNSFWQLISYNIATRIWINIGSGNGLVPDGTKPLSDAMLNYQNYTFTITATSPQANEI